MAPKKRYNDETLSLLRNLCKLTTTYQARNEQQEFLECNNPPSHFETRQ